MAKVRKNYYKKPVGSIAVLGYYVVVPFYTRPAQLSQLLKIAKNAEEIIHSSIQYACAELQASFIVEDELYDDGLVEMHPIVTETHVSVYMKLPATISVHSAISQLRIFSSKFLLQTGLAKYKETYNSLYSCNYLAMCASVDASGAPTLSGQVYSKCLKTFFLENELEGNPQNIHVARNKMFGKKPFMSEAITLYE